MVIHFFQMAFKKPLICGLVLLVAACTGNNTVKQPAISDAAKDAPIETAGERLKINFEKFHFFNGAVQGCNVHENISRFIGFNDSDLLHEIIVQNYPPKFSDYLSVPDSLYAGRWSAVIFLMPKKQKKPGPGESEFDTPDYIFPCIATSYLYKAHTFTFLNTDTLADENSICEYKKSMVSMAK